MAEKHHKEGYATQIPGDVKVMGVETMRGENAQNVNPLVGWATSLFVVVIE